MTSRADRNDWPIPMGHEALIIDNTVGGIPLSASEYRPSGGGTAASALITVYTAPIAYSLLGEDPRFGVFPAAALAVGVSAPAKVATGAFFFVIDGVVYYKAAAETTPGNDVVPEDVYGAVALDIGADGTIDYVEAADNATGYSSAVLAVAGLAACASDHIRLGYVTAMKSDGSFTFGTTSLAATNVTAAFTSTAVSAAPGNLQAANTSFWLESFDCIAGFRAVRSGATNAIISVIYFKM